MFRKIVSNLPFSPALIGELGFYAKRLRKEETTRRLGLIFVALALVVQSLAVFQPPESANASSDFDMVTGGISSIDDFLAAYDNNTKNLRDVMNQNGITREEIASTYYGSFQVGNIINWSYASRLSYDEGERQYDVLDESGDQVANIYSRPLNKSYDSSAYVNAWIGNSDEMGWFAILQSCGNLETKTIPTIPTPVTTDEPKKVVSEEPEPEPESEPEPEPEKCAVNHRLLASDDDCQACPGDETIWADSPICVPNITKSKKADNLSKGFVNATSVKASADDRISYTITVSNTGLDSKKISLKDDLSDILDYSTLVDNGGGRFNGFTKMLSWSSVTLEPGEDQTRTFVVKVLDNIPSTAKGTSDTTSYDCIMTNVFGNSININVDCPVPKIVETVTSQLPKTGPSENIIFACVVLATTAYFYTRSRQLGKELRLVRKNASAGTI